MDSWKEYLEEPLKKREGVLSDPCYRLSAATSGAMCIQARYDPRDQSFPAPHLNIEQNPERRLYPDIPNHVPLFETTLSERLSRAKQIAAVIFKKYRGEITLEELLSLVPEAKDSRTTWTKRDNSI
ncbi:MAG: hypothetical protein Q7R47_05930 [Candidatus Diapherotrites archaeon]|nr:hypothetical protein [Candidatus Diapherotrites archaeon]